jgi:uncharacterized membrane protein
VSWIFDEEVLAVMAAITVVATVFAVYQMFYAGRVVEPFSELGLLGPAGKIGDYPKEVVAGSPFLLNVYVGNQEGKAVFYKVLIKAGDKSSVVNASMPLLAKPLMDIRVVLGHNTSRIIPVNVTLYEPAFNVRLVFEMWVYNETAREFSYYGRWNHLWINVTKPLLQVSPPQQTEALSPEFESRLVEAYLAVRRAENAGGDISEMINLLNSAIEYASSGNLSEAESLLSRVFTFEPDVTETGIQAGRIRLYVTAGGLAVAFSICIGLYLYLKSSVWLIWAKAHRGWRVTWSGGNRNTGDYERKVRDAVKSSNRVTVGDLVGGSKSLAQDARAAARELYMMVKAGVVKIADPNLPSTFPAYLLSRYNAGFISALLMLALGVICIYSTEPSGQTLLAVNGSPQPLFSGLSTTLTLMRYALGSIMVLFLPGYSLVEALYPSEGELSPLERLALSIGLSLALVPLTGLILNYTPWGIGLNPTVTALTILITSLLLVSAYRKFTLIKLKASAKSS